METSSLVLLWEEHLPSAPVWPLLQSPLSIPAKLLYSEPEPGQPSSLYFNKSFFSTRGVVFVWQFLTNNNHMLFSQITHSSQEYHEVLKGCMFCDTVTDYYRSQCKN
jgi:hypothetical protein